MSTSLLIKDRINVDSDGGGDTKHETLKIGGTAPLLNRDVQTFETYTREFHRLGYGHTEMWIEGAAPTLSDMPRIKKAIGDMACTVHAPFVDVSLTTASDALAKDSMSRLRAVCQVADELGASVVTVHPGTWPVFEPKSASVHRFLGRYRALNDSCAATVSIENLRPKNSGVQRTLIQSSSDIADLIDAYPEIGFTLDFAHATQASMDLVSVSREFSDRIASIHLHDVSISGSSHKRLGSGVLRLQQVSDALVNLRAATPITMEFVELGDYAMSSAFVDELVCKRD